jgi:hypothetical protein
MTNQDIEKMCENIFEHLLRDQVPAVFAGRRPSGKWRPHRGRGENSARWFLPNLCRKSVTLIIAKVKAEKIPSRAWRA